MAINGLVSPSMAASAYSNLQNVGGSVQTASAGKIGFAQNDPVFDSKAPSFSDFLRENVQETISTLKGSEQLSAKAITGTANVTDVVQAVTSAELSFQTVVAVRDRIISAYQDIMRMPI